MKKCADAKYRHVAIAVVRLASVLGHLKPAVDATSFVKGCTAGTRKARQDADSRTASVAAKGKAELLASSGIVASVPCTRAVSAFHCEAVLDAVQRGSGREAAVGMAAAAEVLAKHAAGTLPYHSAGDADFPAFVRRLEGAVFPGGTLRPSLLAHAHPLCRLLLQLAGGGYSPVGGSCPPPSSVTLSSALTPPASTPSQGAQQWTHTLHGAPWLPPATSAAATQALVTLCAADDVHLACLAAQAAAARVPPSSSPPAEAPGTLAAAVAAASAVVAAAGLGPAAHDLDPPRPTAKPAGTADGRAPSTSTTLRVMRTVLAVSVAAVRSKVVLPPAWPPAHAMRRALSTCAGHVACVAGQAAAWACAACGQCPGAVLSAAASGHLSPDQRARVVESVVAAQGAGGSPAGSLAGALLACVRDHPLFLSLPSTLAVLELCRAASPLPVLQAALAAALAPPDGSGGPAVLPATAATPDGFMYATSAEGSSGLPAKDLSLPFASLETSPASAARGMARALLAWAARHVREHLERGPPCDAELQAALQHAEVWAEWPSTGPPADFLLLAVAARLQHSHGQ